MVIFVWRINVGRRGGDAVIFVLRIVFRRGSGAVIRICELSLGKVVVMLFSCCESSLERSEVVIFVFRILFERRGVVMLCSITNCL